MMLLKSSADSSSRILPGGSDLCCALGSALSFISLRTASALMQLLKLRMKAEICAADGRKCILQILFFIQGDFCTSLYCTLRLVEVDNTSSVPLSLTFCVIFHPAVDLLGHGCRLAEVYSFHFSPEVLPHQLQELRVKGDALLQEEAVGESDDVVGVIVRQSRRQVLEQRELPAWRTEAHTHIFNSVDNVCTSPLLCNKPTLMLLTLCVCV